MMLWSRLQHPGNDLSLLMSVSVHCLVDTLADAGYLPEFGLSLFVESDGRRILFDTGAGEALVTNATRMGIDLDSAMDIDERLERTAACLASLDLERLVLMHCTGENAVDYLRSRLACEVAALPVGHGVNL